MYAADTGHTRVAKYLLKNGANPAVVGDGGFTALVLSAQEGHLAVTKMLIKAGSRLEDATCMCATPLHLAGGGGHTEVMKALIQAGGNVNNGTVSGETPLYSAAQGGKVDVIKELLRAGADPLLERTNRQTCTTSVPLDTAVENGRREVVHLLLQRAGLRGCGGPTISVNALKCAVKHKHVDIMVMLTDSGVVDNGKALKAGCEHGREASVKFLLQHKAGEPNLKRSAYVNVRDDWNAPPLLPSIEAVLPFSIKVVRLLIDAGADTTSTVRYMNINRSDHSHTPLEFTNFPLYHEVVEGERATRVQLRRLKVIRRLMMQVEAVHAVSWLWPTNDGAPAPGRPKISASTPSTPPVKTASPSSVASRTPVGMMTPAMKQGDRTRGVLLAALFSPA
ncbi:unnamed protein product [Pylaiella littoralis]